MTDQDLQGSPLFAEPSDDAWRDSAPGVRRRVLVSQPELMMVEFAFAAGAVGALHRHPHVQCSYVHSGRFAVTIDGATRELGPGAAFIVPSQAEHGVRAVEAGRLVDVFTPRRDDFLA